MAAVENSKRIAMLMPPPPPPEATGVVPIFERRRTLIDDPRGTASEAAERVLTSSLLQGALITCCGIAVWAAHGLASSSQRYAPWVVVSAAVLAVLLALLAWRAARHAATATRRLIATGSEPRIAEVTACREAKRDMTVVRIAATLAPVYAVFAIAKIQLASLPLLSAAAIFGLVAVVFARRTADRLGKARYASRVIGFREDRAS